VIGIRVMLLYCFKWKSVYVLSEDQRMCSFEVMLH
jgi:hypothetical protein